MKKRRHLTPHEIMEQCKTIAREKRMADRTPWTAMAIMCGYTVMRSEGFKGIRINRLTNYVNDMEEKWCRGEVDLKELSDKLMEKADWTIEYKQYAKEDITAKKGSYAYWIVERQLNPQNTINEQAARYLMFFYHGLMDVYGYGKKRLTRVEKVMNKLLRGYAENNDTVHTWHRELLDEAGIVMEMPIDPLTQKM
jgi:hypothetical protein